jgi:hypothetical protein
MTAMAGNPPLQKLQRIPVPDGIPKIGDSQAPINHAI